MESESSSDRCTPAEAARPPARDPFRWLLAAVLRGGVYLSAALLILGLILYFLAGTPRPIGSEPFAGRSVGIFGSRLLAGDPVAFLSAGLGVLVVLPVARVLLSLGHFVRQRDWVFVTLTCVVLAVLFIGIVFGADL